MDNDGKFSLFMSIFRNPSQCEKEKLKKMFSVLWKINLIYLKFSLFSSFLPFFSQAGEIVAELVNLK